MSDKKWINAGSTFDYADIPNVSTTLPFGIYELNHDKLRGFYLDKISDKFELPEKVYESERKLIDRIKNTFNSFDKNFGILLKGLKGTGKTLVSKQLSNELNIPVILVNNHFEGIGNFINSINQDLTIIFDEFEKVYNLTQWDDEEGEDTKKGIANLLTLMDGVFTSPNKRLFILTTNKSYMPDAIMSRPSRIRYVKEFTDLDQDTIMLILNDIVANKELISDLVTFLSTLEIITVDIVKTIAEEANLYNRADNEFFSIFNVKTKDDKYELFKINDDGSETLVDAKHGLILSNLYEGLKFKTNNGVTTITDIDFDEETIKTKNNKNVEENFIFKKIKYFHESLKLIL